MSLKSILRKLACCARQEWDEEEEHAERPLLELPAHEPMEPGPPYQDFVDSEARKYWQEMANTRKLTKLTEPTQGELRAAAMPILSQALRRRTGSTKYTDPFMAHRAVADVVQHAREQRWTNRPLSDPYASPTYIDALIQLADDALWLAYEFPLPAHPPPKHPPIYYTIDPENGIPVPRPDSLILGSYVYLPLYERLTNVRHYRPWLSSHFDPSLFVWPGRAYFSLSLDREKNLALTFHTAKQIPFRRVVEPANFQLRNLYFSPRPQSIRDHNGE